MIIILTTVYLVGAIAFAADEDDFFDLLWPLFALAYIVEKLHPKIGNSSETERVETVPDPMETVLDIDEDVAHQKRIEDWERRFRRANTKTVLDLESAEKEQPESESEPSIDIEQLKRRLVKSGSRRSKLRAEIHETLLAFENPPVPDVGPLGVDIRKAISKKVTHQIDE